MSISSSNPQVVKRAFLRALAAAGFCGLAWQVVAAPFHSRLAAASAEAAMQQAELCAFNDSIASMPVLPEQVIDDATRRAHRLEELSKQTGDASSLYDALASVARDSGVRIERIEPRQASQGARSGSKAGVEATSFGVEISGDFASVVGFVDRVESRIGLTRVTGLRVRPTIATSDSGQPGVLAATVDTTHFRLAQSIEERLKSDQAAAKATTKGSVR